MIVSNDKDMFQLVTEKVKVLHQSKEDILFDPAKVKDFFGSLMLRELFKGLALTGKYISVTEISAAFDCGSRRFRLHRTQLPAGTDGILPLARAGKTTGTRLGKSAAG